MDKKTFEDVVKVRYDIESIPMEEFGEGQRRAVLNYEDFRKLCKQFYDLGHNAGYKKAEDKYIQLISC